jgi:hypothetical protein
MNKLALYFEGKQFETLFNAVTGDLAADVTKAQPVATARPDRATGADGAGRRLKSSQCGSDGRLARDV